MEVSELSNKPSSKNKWNTAHYVHVSFLVKRDMETGKSLERERLQALAAKAGKSTSRYIVDAINAYAGEQVITPLDDESRKKKNVGPVVSTVAAGSTVSNVATGPPCGC